MPDGKSLPYHTNKKRVLNGTHNFLTLTRELSNKGCHPSSLKRRRDNIIKFITSFDSNKIILNKSSFNIYLKLYPDKTENFNYDGFLYSLNYFNKKENLGLEIINEDC